MNMAVTSPRLRRAYFECRHGQLHVHNAIPAGGGFDELTTLVCLHAAHNTGRVFLEVSRILGNTRSVYSPDLPGCGESDAPPKQLSIGGYAEAICDFLDSMRFRQVDLLGTQSGSAIAAELAIAKPKIVRKVALVSVPALDESERKSYRDLSAPEGMSQGALWARAAIINWKAQERLPMVKQPLLVLRPKDAFWEAGGRVAKMVPGAKVVDMADQDKRLLEAEPERVAKQLSAFFSA
jgi:pimeloyl-ACP methyl ester carboxylesterase